MSRACALVGALTVIAIGLDRSISADIFRAAWVWRLVVGGVCILIATSMLGMRRCVPERAGLAYGLGLLLMMAVIAYAGASGPPWAQDRYALASILLFSAALAGTPVPFVSAIPICVLGTIIYPTLPILFGADTKVFASDLFVAAGAAFVVLTIIRKNEVDRRRRFLEELRYELAATELSVSNRELLRLSNTDALTGLPNRRYFEAEADRLCAERDARSVGAIILDIDDFKKFNDSAGHVAGDVCLRSVARALSGSLHNRRSSLARYGGEEFAAFVPSISPRDLEKLAQELCEAVARLQIPHPAFLESNVSVSVGLAWSADVPSCGPMALLEEADRGLYAAKAAGRNRIGWGPCSAFTPAPGVVSEQAPPRPISRSGKGVTCSVAADN
ncbi:hypothetical protein AOQ71_34685 [Bradyrhizobium manausense]|uniref:diguanylate cyclase n=2 Tax=Bradyrhizobium manausense TaxID=989370 RepID=A0A0R3CXP7_9BRAD|nr:hypothetical protein AOQ71_34685 [Bradyrhizobium manausense]